MLEILLAFSTSCEQHRTISNHFSLIILPTCRLTAEISSKTRGLLGDKQ